MNKFNDLLNLRFKTKNSSKMTALVEKSSNGDLSSFSGVFRVVALNANETNLLQQILLSFRHSDTYDVESDLNALSSLSSEVKAITNQAVILHGERIKKAQNILKNYRDGAFTAWLYATYGNRQTPYNFLQYYEFYSMMPQTLHLKIDQMPRQAIYTLASRSGLLEEKEEIVKNYSGESKDDLLKIIRERFPLAEEDKRIPHFGGQGISHLKRARELFRSKRCKLSTLEKAEALMLLAQLRSLID